MSKWAFQYCAPVLDRLIPSVTACAGLSYRVRPLSRFGRNQSRTQLLCSLPYPKKKMYGENYACTFHCPVFDNQLNYFSVPYSLQVYHNTCKETSGVGRRVSPNIPQFIFLLTHWVKLLSNLHRAGGSAVYKTVLLLPWWSCFPNSNHWDCWWTM